MNLLTVVTFLPLLGALALVMVPRDEAGQLRAIALGTSLLAFALSLALWFGFDAAPGAPEFQFELMVPWMPSIGIGFHVGLDGVALLLYMLTTVLTPIVILSAWTAVDERVKEFMIALLVLESAMLGTFIALDLVLFYVFWEAMLIPMYLLIGIWGSQNRHLRHHEVLRVHVRGQLLMLLAILYVYFHDGGNLRLRRGAALAAGRLPARPAGCSSPSRSPSRSRCRCSRCTPGCPTRTPRRPPPAR